MTQPVDCPADSTVETELATRIGVAPRPLTGATWYSGLAWRTAAVVVAVVPLGLLGVASQLQPASAGLGTHQQLGLPPCSMRLLFAMRCPSCGMTTSWAHFVRGQWAQSAEANLGGFLLALFSIPLATLAIRALVRGKLPSVVAQQVVTFIALSIMVLTLMDWVLRITWS